MAVSALLAGASFIGMAAEMPYIGYRVTKVVKGGKNLSFAALVVVGDANANSFLPAEDGANADACTSVDQWCGWVAA